MKVRVKTVFFDDNGIHKVGEIAEVKVFNEDQMELIEEKKSAPKKAVKKEED